MRNKAAASGEADRFSLLPDELLQTLLSFLPADEAVRTCVLARRWRHLWRHTPGLRLVEHDTFRPKRFVKFVNHLVVLRGHSLLVKCEFGAHKLTGKYTDDDVTLWIQYALLCKVHELKVVGDMDNGMVLRRPLISPHLRTLDLEDLDLYDRFVDFSSCRVLEGLKIHNCYLEVQKVSANSLKRLCMTECRFHEDFRTWISAPNLVSLRLDNCSGMTLILDRTPSLQTAFVRLTADCEDCYCDVNLGAQDCGAETCEGCRGYPDHQKSVLLNGLSSAVNLELIAAPEVYVYRRDLACCPIFDKLKTLLLNVCYVPADLNALVCILQHSPMLEKLTIQIPNDKGLLSLSGAEGKQDVIQGLPFACPNLTVVNIECQEIDERVRKIFEILNMCGILREQIRIIKSLGWGSYCFSFEKASQAARSKQSKEKKAAPSSD